MAVGPPRGAPVGAGDGGGHQASPPGVVIYMEDPATIPLSLWEGGRARGPGGSCGGQVRGHLAPIARMIRDEALRGGPATSP